MTKERRFRNKLLCVLCAAALILSGVHFDRLTAKASGNPYDSDAVHKPLEGKTISVLGDSISTYMGYSDKYPITDEDCEYRFGEPYYGPADASLDYVHNNEFLAEDTWWLQSANELGASILVSNAGNSTGLLIAQSPIEEWDHYLKDMLAYKTRPYHLGLEGKDPDIIALYIGSNEIARAKQEQIGSVEDIDFDALISTDEEGNYVYAEPVTAAEAYSIMLHKIKVTYPAAEIYTFTLLPASGGYARTGNKRLETALPMNEMIRGVADYWGATVVDIYKAFDLPDDLTITEEFWKNFGKLFWEGPHPGKDGFDIISACFTNTILENSRYVKEVYAETTPGHYEKLDASADTQSENGNLTVTLNASKTADPDLTASYEGTVHRDLNGTYSSSEHYAVHSADDSYTAEGGFDQTVNNEAPKLKVSISESSGAEGTVSGAQSTTGDMKENAEDGIYDYTTVTVTNPGRLTSSVLGIRKTDENTDAADQMSFLHNNTAASDENGMITAVDPLDVSGKENEIKDGYGYLLAGSDQFSTLWSARAFTTPDYENLPDEEPIYQDEQITLYARRDHASLTGSRRLVVPRIYFEDKTAEGEFPAPYDYVEHFTMIDQNGNPFSAYCADFQTVPHYGYSYNIYNLEDAAYYSAAEASKIRAAAAKGYWGTESGTGSLEAMREWMRASGKYSEEELNRLNDGIAMSATQFAVWTNSNAMEGITFLNAYYTNKVGYIRNGVPADEQDAELLFKIYYDLLREGESSPALRTAANTVFNAQNTFEDVSVEITGRPADDPANLDANHENDVYYAKMEFALNAQDTEGNDLVLEASDENGIFARIRISGELQEGEIPAEINGEGNYVLEGLTVSEGEHEYSFRLTGFQELAEDVYFFVSEEPDGTGSQPMVAYGGGKHAVDLKMDAAVVLNVQDQAVITEHRFRNESKKTLSVTDVLKNALVISKETLLKMHRRADNGPHSLLNNPVRQKLYSGLSDYKKMLNQNRR